MKPNRLSICLITLIIALAATLRTNAADNGHRADVAALLSSYKEWSDVKLPVSVDIDSPVNFRISGQAMMVKNEGIYISLRMFGLEVGAVKVTTDSIIAAIKVKKVYIAESINSLMADFPVTVGNLQSLLFGQAFVPGYDTAPKDAPSKFSFMEFHDAQLPEAFAMSPDAIHGVVSSFVVNGGIVPRLLALTAVRDFNVATVVYEDAVSTPAGEAYNDCIIKADVAQHSIEASLSWRFDRAQWNQGISLPTINTRGYRKIPASSLIGSLSAL